MTRSLEHELMRLLHGELPPATAAALREQIGREPELAAAYARLERTWGALDLPPSPGVPPGFAGRVLARVAAEHAAGRAGGLSWGAAPGWVRAAAAACLIVGAALGAGVGGRWKALGAGQGSQAAPADDAALAGLFGSSSDSAEAAGEDPESLNDSYWGEVADSTLDAGDLDGAGGAAPDGGAAEDTPL